MQNQSRISLTKILADTAMGRKKADLVIKNVNIINTNTREIVFNQDIGIKCGRICLVGDASALIGDETTIIDGTSMYASPGFMDGHIHVESSMMSITEYAKAVIPLGTTAIFHDPHEIANVLGTKGVDIMIEEGKDLPLRTFATMPSCVPAVSHFELEASIITSDETCEYLKKEEIIGLGEMMNMPAVLASDDDVHKKLHGSLIVDKAITGHYTIPELNNGLNAYIASGICCCHESVTKEEALAKLRLGMYVQMREGSAWRDVAELVPLLVETKIDTRFATLVSDDTHPNTLLKNGHIDYIIRLCIELGLDPITAIQMATINTANCFKIADDFGSIAPGKYADIVLFENLDDIRAKVVLIDGKVVAENGKMVVDIKRPTYPDFALNTINITKTFTAEDFVIKAPIKDGDIKTHVVEIIEVKAPNKHIVTNMKVEDFIVSPDLDRDIVKACIVERHHNTNMVSKGFVKGFRLKTGAIASTVSHDAHNITLIGTNDKDIAIAVNTIKEIGGGIVVVKDEKVIAVAKLPLAGLMSTSTMLEIADEIESVENGFIELGCTIKSPFMTMALLSLAVIPELRLTNKGLVDTLKYEFVDLFENN